LFYVLADLTQKQPGLAVAVPLDLEFDSGIMRGRVNPKDGQVYLSGLKGWGTTAKQDGCVARVRYTGKPAYLVKDVTLLPHGLRLDFTCPLDAAAAKDAAHYQAEQWGYIYSEKYGSPEMS